LAAGISGSFQHVMGMKGAGLIVAINRDPKAPIFRIADYGVVDDLFKIVPALTQKLQELKQQG
jgi:electron transfer flavoprotein alpha subunit